MNASNSIFYIISFFSIFISSVNFIFMFLLECRVNEIYKLYIKSLRSINDDYLNINNMILNKVPELCKK